MARVSEFVFKFRVLRQLDKFSDTQLLWIRDCLEDTLERKRKKLNKKGR